MEELIPVINRLQDVLSTVGGDEIDLPQIVVIGSQSSGKSSVLESFVGEDFLPRGSGIVTRRPLVLQLVNVANKDEKAWGEFLHKPNVRFESFEEIRSEIISETDKLTGKNKGISDRPINLKVHSPKVVTLTLVDLPGITRVPIGDQPSDIEALIRDMCKTYIAKQSSIILAVTSANTDLANSDALQMAAQFDPKGERTLGVLTKIDLMDKGTDAMDMLNNKVIPLAKGYIGVVNRSQHDIQANTPMDVAQKAESDFFRNHPRYRTIAKRSGSGYLAQTLNKMLVLHIKNCLPDLRNRVNRLLDETRRELDSYGNSGGLTDNKGATLLQICTKFSKDYGLCIEGLLTRGEEKQTENLYGGARINYIFNDMFCDYMQKMQALAHITNRDIRTAVRNTAGPSPSLFIPEMAFELLARQLIKDFEQPTSQCVSLVYDELIRLVSNLHIEELERFPVLQEKLLEVVHDLLRRYRVPTDQMIKDLLAIEITYINTSHPDFVGYSSILNTMEQLFLEGAEPDFKEQRKSLRGVGGMTIPDHLRVPEQMTDKEKFETELIVSLLNSYFNIVRKNLIDSVPKSIMFFLVNRTKENMQNEMVAALYKDELLDELLSESPEIAERRNYCKQMMEVLNKAFHILNEVRDFAGGSASLQSLPASIQMPKMGSNSASSYSMAKSNNISSSQISASTPLSSFHQNVKQQKQETLSFQNSRNQKIEPTNPISNPPQNTPNIPQEVQQQPAQPTVQPAQPNLPPKPVINESPKVVQVEPEAEPEERIRKRDQFKSMFYSSPTKTQQEPTSTTPKRSLPPTNQPKVMPKTNQPKAMPKTNQPQSAQGGFLQSFGQSMTEAAGDHIAEQATNRENQQKAGAAISNASSNRETQAKVGQGIASSTSNPILAAAAKNSTVQKGAGKIVGAAAQNSRVQQSAGQYVASKAKDKDAQSSIFGGKSIFN